MENQDYTIENKVEKSGLINFEIEALIPKGERILFDIKNLLFQELVLKEKDFREFIKQHDWSQYTNKYVAVHCSTDAIIPLWAYMLLGAELQPYAKKIVQGDLKKLEEEIIYDTIHQIDFSQYKDQRVIVKGCAKKYVPAGAYLLLSEKLKPEVKNLMFGEACSTVPVYKKK
jgi:hypothetical protein